MKPAEPSTLTHSNGFTNEYLLWQAWLPTVQLESASADQIAALEESHHTAKKADYYLTLVHQPQLLHLRSITFNAIMYAPGGLSRAERELSAVAVARINGCIYCSSVHSRFFEQLAKRSDVIEQDYEDPSNAGTTPRERAIVQFSIELTRSPDKISKAHVLALREAGLQNLEILDLVHSVAIFAWATRLMLNLGEPFRPDQDQLVTVYPALAGTDTSKEKAH